MRKILASLVVVCFLFTGCTGSFNLTRKVYNMHRSQDDKWKDEIFFLAVVLIPIYSIATFADAIIFNSIEFWSGENPVEMTSTQGNIKHVKVGEATATLSYDPATEQITVVAQTPEGESTVILDKGEGLMRALDENGKVIYLSTKNSAGDVVVYDSNLQLVKNYSPQEVEQLKEKIAN